MNIPRYKIIAVLVFIIINFFSIVININSATSIQRAQIATENEIKIEQARLENSKKLIENEILEEVKRKQLTSIDERVNPADIIDVSNLESRKDI